MAGNIVNNNSLSSNGRCWLIAIDSELAAYVEKRHKEVALFKEAKPIALEPAGIGEGNDKLGLATSST